MSIKPSQQLTERELKEHELLLHLGWDGHDPGYVSEAIDIGLRLVDEVVRLRAENQRLARLVVRYRAAEMSCNNTVVPGYGSGTG